MGSIPIRFRQSISSLMPRKRPRKKPKTFSAAKEVRRQAREIIGSVPPTRVLKDKRQKPPKHKKRLEDETLLQT